MRIFKLIFSKRMLAHSLYLIIFLLTCFVCFTFLADYTAEKVFHSGRNKSANVYIDWQKEYPLAKKETAVQQGQNISAPENRVFAAYSRIASLSQCIRWMEDRIPGLFFFPATVKLGCYASEKVKPDILFSDPTTAELPGGNLITLEPEEAPDKIVVNSIVSFAEKLQEKKIRFLYVLPLVPYDPEGKNISFANENRDQFLQELRKNKVNVLDLRSCAAKENMSVMDHFYKTDHHWLAELGPWGAKNIVEKMNSDFRFSIDTDKLNVKNYTLETHKNAMLGSLGFYVGRTNAKPEDFSFYIPEYPTDFHIVIPTKAIDRTGTFSDVLIDRASILDCQKKKGERVWGTLLFGNNALTQITNLNLNKGKKILVVYDSFALSVIPYLACVCKQVDAIDIRPTQGNFCGSVMTYIEKHSFDAVILLRYSISEELR